MPKRNQDEGDGFEFDSRELGFDDDEWDELKETLGFETYEELLEAYPDIEDYSEWIQELDYMNELDEFLYMIDDYDGDKYGE